MTDFSRDAVAAAVQIADLEHLLKHASSAAGDLSRLMTDALAEVGLVLQGCGASEEETMRAVDAFAPVLQQLGTTAHMLRERTCAPGCCSSAMSEARWQARALTWGHAAAQVRGLLPTSDIPANHQPAPENP